jgi:hypothetical protein
LLATIKRTYCLCKGPDIVPNFNRIWIFAADLHERPSTKFHGNPFRVRRADTYAQTYRRMDITLLTGAFRDYTKEPKETPEI